MKKWSSYAVSKPDTISHSTSVPFGAPVEEAHLPEKNTRAIFVLAAQKPPYCVYGNTFYDHALYGNVWSVDETGAIDKHVQDYEYAPHSGVHGMVFDPKEEYLYSADMKANGVWTHKKKENGSVELVDFVDAPKKSDQPRWVEMHSSGRYLYALMEAGNNLAVYVIDEKTRKPVFTGITYPLVPPGKLSLTFLISASRYLAYMLTITLQDSQTTTQLFQRRCTAATSSSSPTPRNTSSRPRAQTPTVSPATSRPSRSGQLETLRSSCS